MGTIGRKPNDAPLTSADINDGIVTPDDLSVGHPTWTTGGNVGIGRDAQSNRKLSIQAQGDATETPCFLATLATSGDITYLGTNIDATAKLVSLTPSGTGGADFVIQNSAGNDAIKLGNHLVDSYISISTNNTERMRIDSSGNVGIGAAAPEAKLQVKSGAIRAGTNNSSAGSVVLEGDYNTGHATAVLGTNRSSGGWVIGYGVAPSTATTNEFTSTFANFSGERTALTVDSGGLRFYNAPSQATAVGSPVTMTEAMRIDSSGDVLVGLTTPTDTPTYGGVYISGDRSVGSANAYAQLFINHSSTTNHGLVIKELLSAGGNAVIFLNSSGTTIGTISTTSSATAYNTSSDYRLKEDIQPITDATTRLMSLNPVNFAWKASGSRTDGFIAHEAQSVVPEAVTGEKDAVDAEGNPKYQGIDQSKLVPLLVATVQEQQRTIEALTARIEALENN